MPKKSREKKILTQLHRLKETQTSANVETAAEKVTVKINNLPTPAITTPSKTLTEDFKFIKADLRKTALFATFAIAFEIVLALTVLKT